MVEHYREVEPALRRPDVDDVGAPFPVRLVGLKALGEQGGCDGPSVFAVRGPLEQTLLSRHEAILPYQRGRAEPTNPMAVAHEIAVHQRVFVGAVRKSGGRKDMPKVVHNLPPTLAGRSAASDEVAALAISQSTAHSKNLEARLLRFDEGSDHRLGSFAKKVLVHCPRTNGG